MLKILPFLLSTLLAASSAFAAFTPNKNYNNQATGTNTATWGIVLNSNFTAIDNNLGGTLNISVAGSSDVALTTSQAAFLMHKLTGALTGNINYIFPAGGVYQINNATSGAFTVNVKMAGGTGVIIPQGSIRTVFIDASNLTAQVDSIAGSSLPAADILVGNASNIASPVALSGDCGLSNAGAITCTKTNGSAFAAAATTAIGTSGATIPLLNGANTWSANNAFITQAITDNSTNAATTAFVQSAMAPSIQVFTSSGTYTPTAGTIDAIVEECGAGGGGGGFLGSGSFTGAASGGGSGSYSKALFTAAQIGVSKAVVIGTAGSAGALGNNNGGNGGNTTFGSTLLTAPGGSGGAGATTSSAFAFIAGGTGGTNGSTSGTPIVLIPGQTGYPGLSYGSNTGAQSGGAGGNSFYGYGGAPQGTSSGVAGTGYCSGGSAAGGSTTSAAGGAGAPGIIIVYEYK